MSESGLEHLANVDKLAIRQSWISFGNHYEIRNNKGELLYNALEEFTMWDQMCGSARRFEIYVTDTRHNEVIHFHRDKVLQAYTPPNNRIGTVEQIFSYFIPNFDVRNANGEVVFKIEGPPPAPRLPGIDYHFRVLSPDKSIEFGKITKQWSGFLRETFTTADFFGVSFPLDLDVHMKAVLLGACLMIDFMYFDRGT